jgi:hypothetical protein
MRQSRRPATRKGPPRRDAGGLRSRSTTKSPTSAKPAERSRKSTLSPAAQMAAAAEVASMHAVLLTKINPTEAKRLIREHCAVRGITCD